MAAPTPAAPEPIDFIDLRALLGLLLERLWLATLIFCLCVGAGTAFIAFSPRLYEATATLEVPLQAQNVTAMEEVGDTDFRSLDILKTIEANLQRRSLYEQVMQRPEIQKDPELLAGTLDRTAEMKPGELAARLADWTDVRLQRGTRLIDVRVEHRHPATARALANGIARQFLLESVRARTGSSRSAFDFLKEEVDRTRAALQQSEEALQDFKRAVEIKAEIRKQETELATLSQRYREKHPRMIQTRSLIAALQEQFAGELTAVAIRQGVAPSAGTDSSEAMKQMEARFNILSRQVETERTVYDSLIGRLKETDVTKEIESTPVRIAEEAHLPEKPAKPRKLLILALAIMAGTALGAGTVLALSLLDSSLKTVDQAESALGLPTLAAIPDDKRLHDIDWMKQEASRVIDRLTQDFDSRPDSSAPAAPADKNARLEPLVMVSDPGGRTAEAIRTLRAAVRLLGPAEEHRRLLVTSAVPGEGKSFVASNLAVAFAQEGHRTLLIDLDLRRPMVDTIFSLKKSDRGAVLCLVEGTPLEQHIVSSGLRHLDLLPVGPQAPNPAELLGSGSVGHLIAQAAATYDRVVIDTAPVNAVADTLLVIHHVQTVLLVGHAGKTPRPALARAATALRKTGARVGGFILNRLPNRPGLGADPYHYYYSAGDGYGGNYGSRQS